MTILYICTYIVYAFDRAFPVYSFLINSHHFIVVGIVP